MPNVRKTFDSYKVQYTSSTRSLPLASITCYSGETPVGLVEFVQTAGELRDPFIHQPSDMIFMPYLLGRFHDVLDLLRNEAPLELFFNPEGKWASILTSEAEPVGEGE